MCVDITNHLRLNIRILERSDHRTRNTLSTCSRLCHVIRITRHTVTTKLAINVSSTRFRVFKTFENNNTSTFADDETIAACLKRTGCLCWVVVILRCHRLHVAEPGNTNLRDSGFCSTADHDICSAAADDFKGIAQGMRTSRTSGDNGGVWPFGAGDNRNMTGCHICNHHRNEEW